MFWAAILKNYCHIWNPPYQFFQNAKFHAKLKNLKFGTKNTSCKHFRQDFEENYHIWNKHSRICQNKKKSCKSQSKLCLGPKSLLRLPYLISNFCQVFLKCFLNVGPKMPYLGVLGRFFEKLLPYFKLVLSNLSKCKVSCKSKNPWTWNQKYLFLGIFGLRFGNTVVVFQINHPRTKNALI